MAGAKQRQPELIYGLHPVQAVLHRRPEDLIELKIADRRDARMRNVLQQAEQLGLRVAEVSTEELNRAVPDAVHQGVVALCHGARPLTADALPDFLAGIDGPPLLLILDQVQDPHNLGACLRSADAAGAHAVIVPKDRAVGLTPVVRKVAVGAAETVPLFQVTNLARAMSALQDQGVWIVGAAGEAEQAIHDVALTGPLAIALGAEGKGLRRLTREYCDVLASIPMHGAVSSLNVSVATGVFLFEAARQRHLTPA